MGDLRRLLYADAGKIVAAKSFSWESDHVGIRDIEGIKKKMDDVIDSGEICFCCKCRRKLSEVKQKDGYELPEVIRWTS